MSSPTLISTGRATPPVAAPPARRPLVVRLLRWLVAVLSLGNLAAVLGLLILLCVISERWWFSMALSYLPRAPYLIPSLLLAVAARMVRPRWIWINLFSLAIVAVPIMGLRAPWSSWLSSSTGPTLTVVSCNIQGGKRDLSKIVLELAHIQPDILVLQEAGHGIKGILPAIEGWSVVHHDEYLVASRYPVKLRDLCRSDKFSRSSAMLCEIEGPSGPILICDVHLTTARHGLAQLRPDSVVSGVGVEQLVARQDLRAAESFQTRVFAAQDAFVTPLLALGDFNTPVSSSLFQKYWGDFISAFDVAGLGYGYTAPCSEHRRWPDNTPWVRIDHILCTSHWEVEQCWVGQSDGSDHRLVAARLRLHH
jgi:endonuclease/exonuclease/phosphatase family metal-dependent hydrolase